MKVTVETQQAIVAALMKNSYLYSISKEEMNDGYFSDPSCKIIYKALSVYFGKYGSVPSLNELLISIDDCYYPQVGASLSDVKDVCCRLYDYPEPDEMFIKDKITDFLRKVRSTQVLNNFVNRVKINPNLENDEIVSDLARALEVQLTDTKVFIMNDADKIKEAREAAVGGADSSKIIPSIIPSLNSQLMFGGWQPSTVNMIVAPPGCFTGDTKVMTLDGKSHTFQEMYDNKVKPGIYGCSDSDECVIKTGLSQEVYLSEYTDQLYEIEIDNKYKIKCTPDHPFLMRDGNYVRADQLNLFDELMPILRENRPINNISDNLYETVTNGLNQTKFTHRLSAELIERPEGYKIVHHKDRNKYNNYPDNLEWFKDNSSHVKYHSEQGDYATWGESTRFTSERISEMNKTNWANPEYREKMSKMLKTNGKNSKLVTELNYSKEFQDKTQRGKILSFINRLLLEFPDIIITEDNYDEVASMSSAKRKVWMKGIKKYFTESWNDILELSRNYNHKVTNITPLTLEEKVPVYGIVEAKPFNNFALALDDNHGIFVGNTGKSMFLINEGVNAAKKGFTVLHIFIGDMVEYDGFIRYLSCISGTPQTSLVMMPSEKQMDVVKFCDCRYDNIFSRIFILAYPSMSLTVETLIEDINKFEKQLLVDFDMIVIDYPDNLILDGNSLYSDGGTLYSNLERMARLTKAVVLVASQPQKFYWDHPIIPLEAASESSKKQMAVDVMLTMNTEYRGATYGSMLLAKARKGSVGKIFRFKTDFARCALEEIDEGTFNAMKDSDTSKPAPIKRPPKS